MPKDISRNTDPLYDAIVAYEDAANQVGALTVTTSGAYANLTNAIGGYGNEEDAVYRFEMESTLLTSAHEHWKACVAELKTQLADGAAWQKWFMEPRKWCNNCGAFEVYDRRFVNGTCQDCVADAHPEAEGALMLSVETPHPDNAAFAEWVEDQSKAEDDLLARRAFYGA